MIDNALNVVVNFTSAFADGVALGGTITDTGMYDPNTNGTEVKIYPKRRSNPSRKRLLKLFIRYIAHGIRVRIVFRDDDVGDRPKWPQNLDPLEDENIKGTLTTTLYYLRATGTNVCSALVALGADNILNLDNSRLIL